MKCPKCDYLGFDTGDRCRNCGYDFSLLAPDVPSSASAPAAAVEPELDLHVLDVDDHATPAPEVWLDRLDETLPSIDASTAPSQEAVRDFMDVELTAPSAVPSGVALPRALPESRERSAPPARGLHDRAPALVDPGRPDSMPGPRTAAAAAAARQFVEPGLPLFRPDAQEDDVPLVNAARPRPPLSVRRTPDKPRLRAVPRPVPQSDPEPALEFPEPAITLGDAEEPRMGRPRPRVPGQVSPAALSSPGRRVGAAVLDHAILSLIDVTVAYFTLRMALLGPGDWALLPAVPFVAFLAMIHLAYFYAFTAIGGQTIGKMAVHIRVVGDDGRVPAASQSVRRTLVAAVSLMAFGLGFLPALFGDRRALHDRVARTRVVSV